MRTRLLTRVKHRLRRYGRITSLTISEGLSKGTSEKGRSYPIGPNQEATLSTRLALEKEAAETQYWLELFEEAKIGNSEDCECLLRESTELITIFTSTGKTAKLRQSLSAKF